MRLLSWWFFLVIGRRLGRECVKIISIVSSWPRSDESLTKGLCSKRWSFLRSVTAVTNLLTFYLINYCLRSFLFFISSLNSSKWVKRLVHAIAALVPFSVVYLLMNVLVVRVSDVLLYYKTANIYKLMKVSNYMLMVVEFFRVLLIGESLKVDEIDGRNETSQLRVGQACLHEMTGRGFWRV